VVKFNVQDSYLSIGIHKGDFFSGIVGKNKDFVYDIFGDVVNTTAKFLPLVGSGEIFISGSMFQKVTGFPSAQFIQVRVPSSKKVLKGISVFKVIWEAGENLDPIWNILLYIKPVWKLGKKSFKNSWKQLLSQRKRIWSENEIYKESILSDASIALIVKKIPFSIEIARQIREFLKSHLGQDGSSFLPVQIIIDIGPYLSSDIIVTEDLKVDWNGIESSLKAVIS